MTGNGAAWAVLRHLGPVALAAVMVQAAVLTGSRAVLFPEAVALAFGVWTLRREAWSRPFPLVAVPVPCAVAGTACALLPGPAWVRTAVALVAAVTLVRLAGSPLVPAVSAAVLPVVFDVRDPLYPAAVLVWCTVLAVPLLLCREPRPAAERARWPLRDVVRFLLAALAWIVAGGLAGLPTLVVAPPLLVAGLEFTLRRGRARSRAAARRIGLMTVAGALGATAIATGGPHWLGAAVAVGLVVAAARLLREPLTPAAALALVPFVADVGDPLLVGAAFLAGGTVLTLLPALLAHVPGLRRRTAGT